MEWFAQYIAFRPDLPLRPVRPRIAPGRAVAERTSADQDADDARLAGRDDVLSEVLATVQARDVPVTLLRGAAGSGRTAVLAEVRDRCTAAGARVLEMRATEPDRSTPYGALYRLLSEVGELAPASGEARGSVLALVAKLSAAPDPATSQPIAVQLAGALHAATRNMRPLVVLVDDAQWLDDATAALLEPLVQRMNGNSFSIVLSVRSDADSGQGAAVLRRLRAAGLVHAVTLRPLTRLHSARLIARTLQAKPDAEVVDMLHGAARGLPAALEAGIDAYRRAEALSIVDRHAYLVSHEERPALDDRHPLLAPVRDAGGQSWAVARAMSLLAPLGEQAPRLAGAAIGLDPETVRDALERLRERRVLIRSGRRWRFRVPMIGVALEAGLGPFERRNLAAAAVTAIWDGSAQAEDPAYLPDRLVDAGALVDPQRAGRELLETGGQRIFQDTANASRWLQAAADKLGDPASRAMALMGHAAACTSRSRLSEAAANARDLLSRHAGELEPQLLQMSVLSYLSVIASIGDHTALRHVAEAETPMPGGRAQQVVAQAFALGWQDEWVAGRRLLDENRDLWAGAEPVLEDHVNTYRSGVALMQGDTTELFRFIEDPALWRGGDLPTQRLETVRYEVNMLLALGELQEATELMRRYELPPSQLSEIGRFIVEHSRGDWLHALDIARRYMAAPVHRVESVGWAMLHMGAAQVHTEGGMLARARHMTQRAGDGSFAYLFRFAEAQVSRALGEHEDADALLREAVRISEETGFAVGTELLWAEVALRAEQREDHVEAQEALARLEKMAARLGTGRAELALRLTEARMHGDLAAADAAVALARERGQRYEQIITFSGVAKAGFHTAKLLPEAYELAGELGSLLQRSRLRRAMREHGVPVPDRTTATRENERLLAVLVTEGLTNRQLATVLGATEKSVEGRLTRMFARIGYRSRVELAAAMVTGEYPG